MEEEREGRRGREREREREGGREGGRERGREKERERTSHIPILPGSHGNDTVRLKFELSLGALWVVTQYVIHHLKQLHTALHNIHQIINDTHLLNSLIQSQILPTFHQKFVLLSIVSIYSEPFGLTHRTKHQYL